MSKGHFHTYIKKILSAKFLHSDPDQAIQINADSCGSGSATLRIHNPDYSHVMQLSRDSRLKSAARVYSMCVASVQSLCGLHLSVYRSCVYVAVCVLLPRFAAVSTINSCVLQLSEYRYQSFVCHAAACVLFPRFAAVSTINSCVMQPSVF
jgi:hypothetical protein